MFNTYIYMRGTNVAIFVDFNFRYVNAVYNVYCAVRNIMFACHVLRAAIRVYGFYGQRRQHWRNNTIYIYAGVYKFVCSVYICEWECVCLYEYTYICTSLYIYMHTYNKCMCVCVCVCVCMCRRTNIYLAVSMWKKNSLPAVLLYIYCNFCKHLLS